MKLRKGYLKSRHVYLMSENGYVFENNEIFFKKASHIQKFKHQIGQVLETLFVFDRVCSRCLSEALNKEEAVPDGDCRVEDDEEDGGEDEGCSAGVQDETLAIIIFKKLGMYRKIALSS